MLDQLKFGIRFFDLRFNDEKESTFDSFHHDMYDKELENTKDEFYVYTRENPIEKLIIDA